MAFETKLKAKNLGLRTGRVKFIVLHDTAGNGGRGDAEYLANDPEKRGVSVDFCILKDGTIYQLNHDLKRRCTFHAGRNTAFRGHTNGGVNQNSVGIEIAQKANMKGLSPAYPEAQVRAVAEVCQHLCRLFNLTKLDITTHAKIIRDGSRSDPRNFPWERFWEMFNEKGPQAPESIVNSPIYHFVQEGDTLYSLSRKYTTTVERIKALNEMNTPSNVIELGRTLKVKE
jgi:N-acetyl-anhydromuramyl-L-alanine amidase AmpD